ncbi:MAG: glycosyltransferase [Kiritimatiellae bacterium]|nr:glycosyltransferase [Kiritimatiellia bacterium]
MKIVQVNQQDIGGGGFIAAFRLHRAFRDIGHESRLVVISKLTDDPDVIPLVRPNFLAKAIWRALDNANSSMVRRYRGKPCYGWVAHDVPTWAPYVINRLTPDAINLNFFNCMLSARQVASLKAPCFWSFHDMHPFTGGCHYTRICDRYLDKCGSCPELASDDTEDISNRGHTQRKQIWNSGIVGVTQSVWLTELARSSTLCQNRRIERIPMGVPLDIFHPSRRHAARHKFRFQDEKFYVLAGASSNANALKGIGFVEEAADLLAAQFSDRLVFVTFGSHPSKIQNVEVLHLGYLKTDAELADIYSACDLYVLPTLLDNLPQMLMESIACGTPAITFDIGGCPDIIADGVNGTVVREHSVDAVATSIERFATMPQDQIVAFRDRSRSVAAEKFDILDCARKYIELFSEKTPVIVYDNSRTRT